jgi:hypothetical protein
MTRKLQQEWEEYRQFVFDARLPSDEVATAKRDFYSGAQVMFMLLMFGSTKAHERKNYRPEDLLEDIHMVKGLESEITDFAHSMVDTGQPPADRIEPQLSPVMNWTKH